MENGEGSRNGKKSGGHNEGNAGITGDQRGREGNVNLTTAPQPEIATMTATRGAAVRADKVSKPEAPDQHEDSLYAVVSCNAVVSAGLGREAKGRGGQ